MAIYINKTANIDGSVRPSSDIDPRDKNADWMMKYAKYIYGQYVSSQTGITPSDADRITTFRTYMDGKQDYLKYKKKYLSESEDQTKNEYGHINWENIYSPMPKIVNKVVGTILGQEHTPRAVSASESAKQYRIKNYAEKYVATQMREARLLLDSVIGVNPDQDPELNPMYGFIAKDITEIDIMASSGNLKIPYEVATEKTLQATQNASDYKHLRREAIRDLTCGFVALREVIDTNGNFIKWEYVDITDVIIEYSKTAHFNNSSYVGLQEHWTVEDLKAKGFKEEDIKKACGIYFDYNMTRLGYSDKQAFQFHSRKYAATGTTGYDNFVLPVLYVAFKSKDVTYLNKVTNAIGEDVLYKGDFGKIKQNTVVDSIEKIYECRWIIGTDIVFDTNPLFLTPRDSVGKVKLPIHVAKLKGMSIVESCIQPLDELAMLGYKLQHALARSQGKQPVFDFSSIEGITSNSGGKLHPFDIIEMYWQGVGVASRSIPLDENVNYSRPKPVEELAGGIGGYLNELLTLKQSYMNDIVELTGVSAVDNSNQGLAVGTARLAIANMADVLRPLYDILLEVKEKLAYNTIYRVQLLLLHDDELKTGATKIYTSLIGKHYTELLKEAGNVEPMDIGISFEVLPTEETKAAVMAAIERCLQPGKSGEPIIKIHEYLYLVDIINTPYGLKEARLLLEYREKQDEIKARANQQAAIQSQSQAIEQQIAVKGQMDTNKEVAKSQGQQAIVQMTKDLDLRNQQILHGDKAAYDTYNKGFDAAAMQEQPQAQPQQQ